MINPAAAGPGPVSRFDRIDDDTAEDQPFWLYDPDGVPVVIPSACVGFQVRFWAPNQRGLGTIVTDPRNGRPLILPRTVTPDEFAERVRFKVGRYRLFLLDGAHQRMDVDPGQIEITPEMAAARCGDLSTEDGASSSSSSSVGGDVLGQVLAFVKESNAHVKESTTHALEQIASLQRDLAESQRQTTSQLATVVGAVAGVLSAAGTSGLVKKTTALDAAAAGAPVTVQMASNGNEATPRNGAGSTPATAAMAATVATAAAEKNGIADALMALGMPLIEKMAPVAAYSMAIKADVPEEVARDLAGFVRSTTQAAGAMLKADAPATTATDAAADAVATRVGAELLAHVMRIQAGLPEADRAWVSSMMVTAPGLIDALKPAVASLTVEEGIGAVRTLRAIDAVMTAPHERQLFGYMLKPEVLPSVFRPVLVDRTTEEAIEYVRARAAQMAE